MKVATIALAAQKDVLGRLQRCDLDEHSREYLLPLIIKCLYVDGDEKTGEQIGAALMMAIKSYLDERFPDGVRHRMSSRMLMVLAGFIEIYLEAIFSSFTGSSDDGQQVADEAMAYCRAHLNDLAS